jgi:hypothetical protein
MLGVRRASISTCVAGLQHEGLIDYGRRRLIVRDRAGLEAVSCECYAAARGTPRGRFHDGTKPGLDGTVSYRPRRDAEGR